MCGIAGIVGTPQLTAVEKMVAAMHHRGPDDNGVWQDETASIGMARLSILDLSMAGHQPMVSADGRYIIVYNGEVYNFQELRKSLQSKGYHFRSNTDTEVVLNMFAEYGRDSLLRLRGMFAFAVWDTIEKTLFVARDHYGIKPLLYSLRDGILTFASEIKAILASGRVERSLYHQSLRAYLAFGISIPPETMITGLKMLLPGHYLVWKRGNVSTKRWYHLQEEIGLQPSRTNYQEAREELRELVLESVVEQQVSDVPLGLFMSGGLDSAVLAAAMKSSQIDHFKAYTIGFHSSSGKIDETADARETSNALGAIHSSLLLDGKAVADDFELFVKGLDRPSIDGLNSYFVSKFARQEVTVALSGLGGDELFGGYPWFYRLLSESNDRTDPWRKMVRDADRNFPALAGNLGKIGNRISSIAREADFIRSYTSAFRVFPDDMVNLLVPPEPAGAGANDLYQLYSRFDEADPANEPLRISILDMMTFMSARVLRDSDAVGMIHSLEVRFPLISPKIVEFALSLPVEFKFGGELANLRSLKDSSGMGTYGASGVKKVLFEAFQNDLPATFFKRKKQGFVLPHDEWLKTVLLDRVTQVTSGRSTLPFDKKALIKAGDDWRKGKLGWSSMFALIVLDEWNRSVVMSS